MMGKRRQEQGERASCLALKTFLAPWNKGFSQPLLPTPTCKKIRAQFNKAERWRTWPCVKLGYFQNDTLVYLKVQYTITQLSRFINSNERWMSMQISDNFLLHGETQARRGRTGVAGSPRLGIRQTVLHPDSISPSVFIWVTFRSCSITLWTTFPLSVNENN